MHFGLSEMISEHGVEYSERARPELGVGTLFSKGSSKVVHMASVAAT